MSLCARCGASFSCGMVDGANGNASEPCWCTTLPVISEEVLAVLRGADASASCFCPACLQAALATVADQRSSA